MTSSVTLLMIVVSNWEAVVVSGISVVCWSIARPVVVSTEATVAGLVAKVNKVGASVVVANAANVGDVLIVVSARVVNIVVRVLGVVSRLLVLVAAMYG